MRTLGWLLSATALTAMIAMIAAGPPGEEASQVAKKTTAVSTAAEEAAAHQSSAMLQKSVKEEVAKKKADVETQYAARIANSPTPRRPALAATIVVGNAVRAMNITKKATIRYHLTS